MRWARWLLQLAKAQVDAGKRDEGNRDLRGLHDLDPAMRAVVNERLARLLIDAGKGESAGPAGRRTRPDDARHPRRCAKTRSATAPRPARPMPSAGLVDVGDPQHAPAATETDRSGRHAAPYRGPHLMSRPFHRPLRLVAGAALAVLLLAVAPRSRTCSTVGKDKRGEPRRWCRSRPANVAQQALGRQRWRRKVAGHGPAPGDRRRPRVMAAAVDGGDACTGPRPASPVWRYASELPLSGGPGAGEGLVVVGSLEGDVIALDAATGTEKGRPRSATRSLPRRRSAAAPSTCIPTMAGHRLRCDHR